MKDLRYQKELNHPSSLEAMFRDDFYNNKHRVKMDEVELKPLKGSEGVRQGWYDFGSKVLAWGLTDILPQYSGPMHRQLCESTMYVLEGRGYTLVNGRKFDWEKGDVLFVPLFAWHQHFNAGKEKVRYARMSTAPLFEFLGIYREENLLPPSSWERSDQESGAPGKVLVKKGEWLDEACWKQGKGGQLALLDFNYRIPTTPKVPSRIYPGQKDEMHRHASEAQIFIYQGSGFSTVNDVRVDFEQGDVLRVPLYSWHQHTNTGSVPMIWLKHTSAALYNRLGILMRDAKPNFDGDVSVFKDDFKPY
jgi:gentisate 1,2-dioxygenase